MKATSYSYKILIKETNENSLTREPYEQRSIDRFFDFPKLSLPLPLVCQAALVTRLDLDYSYNDRKMRVGKHIDLA